MASSTPRKRNSNPRDEEGDIHQESEPSPTMSSSRDEIDRSKPPLTPATVDNEHCGPNSPSSAQLPLTWTQARSRMRQTLEQWNSERKRQRNNNNNHNDDEVIYQHDTTTNKSRIRGGRGGILQILLSVDDPDMIFLAIPLSLLFVILSFALPNQQQQSEDFTKMQQAASLLFFISSITSAWMTRRRRRVSRDTDRSIERRRCVSAFLESMKDQTSIRQSDQVRGVGGGKRQKQQQQQQQRQPQQQSRSANFMDSVDTIPRKNVEDVYSTYRLVDQHNQSSDDVPSSEAKDDIVQGQWHRIPSLLLVKGDFIALKVGDTAPAKCQAVTTFSDGTNTYSTSATDGSDGAADIIQAGERLAIDSLSPLARDTLALEKTTLANVTSSSSIASAGTVTTANTTTTTTKSHPPKNKKGGLLPPGRSTLKYHSNEILLLSNGLRVFVLLETPLDAFLRKEVVKKYHALPQVLRQGEAIRSIFLKCSLVAFVCTLFVLLVRPGGAQRFFQTTTWTLPLLAALGMLPVVTPIFLFWVECIGTSRILATVHPLASNQKQQLDSSKGMAESYRQESTLSLGDHSSSESQGIGRPSPWLLFRYLFATSSSRLVTKSLIKKISAWTRSLRKQSYMAPDALLSIPPASLHLLEKLGIVTALALVDDELACEPFSTPQQLLIPASNGFTLLDICPVYDGDAYSTDDENNNENTNQNNNAATSVSRRQSSDLMSIDSDDDSNEETRFNHSFSAPARTLRKIRRNVRKKKYVPEVRRLHRSGSHQQACQQCTSMSGGTVVDYDDVEVQFEDPQWWKHLPSLKCIGLGCLLVEKRTKERRTSHNLAEHTNSNNPPQKVSFDIGKSRSSSRTAKQPLPPVQASLIDHISDERERKQLRLLAQCIGFDTNPNALGPRGDLSSFYERRRLHILSTNLLRQRMQLDSHALGLEESRNWSRLFTDADTVFVRDKRSGGDLVLTVGDARVVTQLCPDWWQGENSTISPLTAADRQIINETQKNWMLSDLDVQAFSYAPLPYTADQKIELGGANRSEHIYLLDNAMPNAYIPSHGFWSLVKNQIFLGMLGSSVRPRKEIEPMIDSCSDAGVRFVYFSPRNMRRTKELASQMGIDVAWNCAISLRPLEEGTDDSFRMTSNYADWDVNARLPHGVDDVRRHLEEVDNVPLLVSLYTDVTKKTAADMVNVFQEYNDTVLSVGLSHLPGNQEIFSRADIAVGVDVLGGDVMLDQSGSYEWNALQPSEVSFVISISAHSSVFNLRGSQVCHFEDIIRTGRACLEAAKASVSYVLSGLLSFGIFILLCPCTAATAVPTIPTLGSFLYTQLLLPLVGLSMVSTDEAKDFMTRVPPKNDLSVQFSFRANTRLYLSALLRSALPAIIPQFLYLIALGELMWEFDATFVETFCLSSIDGAVDMPPIAAIIRCEALRDYSGPAIQSAGTITLASLAICSCVVSASYVFRTESIRSEPPWKRNHLWRGALVTSFVLIAVYMAATLKAGSMTALSWYFYLLFLLNPFICLYFCELVKKMDQKHEKRAVMMRRLQFETRLGMWSPKESTHPGDMNNLRRESRSPIV